MFEFGPNTLQHTLERLHTWRPLLEHSIQYVFHDLPGDGSIQWAVCKDKHAHVVVGPNAQYHNLVSASVTAYLLLVSYEEELSVPKSYELLFQNFYTFVTRTDSLCARMLQDVEDHWSKIVRHLFDEKPSEPLTDVEALQKLWPCTIVGEA